MEKSKFNKNSKIIETVNYNGKYVDVCTIKAKIILIAIALGALASVGGAILLF